MYMQDEVLFTFTTDDLKTAASLQNWQDEELNSFT